MMGRKSKRVYIKFGDLYGDTGTKGCHATRYANDHCPGR